MQNLRIYDTRDRNKAQITVEAHTADVNVLSWNTLTSYMLATGGDDGMMRVWDLRSLDSYVASFNYHKKPICGIEWCPHESSMLSTCSEVRRHVTCALVVMRASRAWRRMPRSALIDAFALRDPNAGRYGIVAQALITSMAAQDNSVAVWDLALERDPEEEARLAAESLHLDQAAPAQLLFLHAGQTDIKEVHWHPQVPGLLASTAGDCFNVFKPSNVFETSAGKAAA